MSLENKNTEENYINEIIRITYKCNWKCKFCNVSKTNNFGDKDISYKEVIHKILLLTKKYNKEQISNLILSFSGGEPTINTNLTTFIKLAKSIGVGTVQIQTNGTILFKNYDLLYKLIDSGLDEIFLAQHSGDDYINKDLGVYYNINDFKKWILHISDNNIHKKIQISFNIVINKINIFSTYKYILFLKDSGFIELLPLEDNNGFKNTKRISMGLVQPNGYANLNKDEVLLRFDKDEIKEIHNIINLCKDNNIYPDFHFTSPPLCILNIPEYNLEHHRMLKLKKDINNIQVNEGNLESYKHLWKEKRKMKLCKKCKYNDYCLGFYNNWIDFVGEDYVNSKINDFLNN